MSNKQKSTALYTSPFSKAYWKDAAAELKSTQMLVITALMIALRVALKPLAIPIGPQLSIQTAMLATALGSMIFGPVMAIPAAIVSDTVGFMIYPTGDYFLPFVLTEIASTMIYALFLYRSNVTPTRVMLSRFCICFFVNVVLQQFIFAWYYVYIGNPEQAKSSIMGITTVARIFKNLAFFPIESVVLTLFLKVMLPITQRAKLTFGSNSDMRFTKKQVLTLVALMLVGILSATGYLFYRYSTTSRSADYATEERVEIQQSLTQLVQERTEEAEGETLLCIVDSAYRPLFGKQTDYTLSVYVLDEDAFAAGQAADSSYTMDTLWAYSKSGPKKDKYQSLIKIASCTLTQNEQTGEILTYQYTPVE